MTNHVRIAKPSSFRAVLMVLKLIIIGFVLGFFGDKSLVITALFTFFGLFILITSITERESTVMLTNSQVKVIEHGYFGIRKKTIEFDIAEVKEIAYKRRKETFNSNLGLSQLAFDVLFPSQPNKLCVLLIDGREQIFNCYARTEDIEAIDRLIR